MPSGEPMRAGGGDRVVNRQSTTLMLNTGATFIRMAITVWMGLFTARLLLAALGADGFGGYAVLFAAASLSAIVGDSLWNSTMTRLALELGRGERGQLREVFNTALATFGGAAALTLVAGFALSAWIPALVNVPSTVAEHAVWPFRFLVLSFAIAMLGTPFKALLQAHQELLLQAVVDTTDSLGRLTIAFTIFLSLEQDRLYWLCVLLAAHAGVVATLLAVLAMHHHCEARPAMRWFRHAQLRRLLAFGVWDILATGSWRLRLQGAQLLLAANFVPATSAAYALAVYVGMLQLNFATALYRAVQPAILTAEGRGNRVVVKRLVIVSGKYMVLGMLLLLIPAMLETETVLGLWLGADKVPPDTAVFTRLTTAWVAVYYLSMGYQMAAQGTPLYRVYALWLLCVDGVTLACAAVAVFVLGRPAWTVPALFLMMTVVLTWGRAVLVGRVIDLRVRDWLRGGVLPVVVAGLVALLVDGLARRATPPGAARLALVAGGYVALSLPIVWLFGLDGWERDHFRRVGDGFLQRLRTARRRLAPAGVEG